MHATAAARANGPFIVSPAFDGVFFFASVATVLLAWFAAAQLRVDPFFILAAVAVVSNGPHLASTWTRVYLDAREWKARPVQAIAVPIGIAAAVTAIVLFAGAEGTRLLNSVLLYWATWHFVAQNWGLLRIYQRRSGEPEDSIALRLEKPLLFLWVLWCLLHRLYTGPRILFGTEVIHLPLPRPLVDGLLGPFVVLLVVYLGARIRQRHAPWARAAWVRAGFLVCAFLGFAIPFLVITTDDTTAFAAAACWHGLQYIGIVAFYHHNAWKRGIHPEARIISFVSQPGAGRRVLYAGLLLGLVGAAYGAISLAAWLTRGTSWNAYTWGSVVWLSLTFSHYYLDGVIWKLSRSPEVAQRVGLQPG